MTLHEKIRMVRQAPFSDLFAGLMLLRALRQKAKEEETMKTVQANMQEFVSR